MTDFLILLLSMSLSGSFLALLLFALRPFLSKMLSGAWMYYIWIIVALRMLLPFAPQHSLLNHSFHSIRQLGQEQAFSGNFSTGQPSGGSALSGTQNASDTALLPEAIQQATAHTPALTHETGADTLTGSRLKAKMQFSFIADAAGHLPTFISAFWLVTAILLLLRTAAGSWIFLNKIRRHSLLADSPEIQSCYKDACGRLAVRRPPGLLISADAASPMLAGLLRPAVILPAAALRSPENLSYIFLHELTHYQRKDLWYKWLFELVKCVHFFNPLTRLLRRQVERCCELSCDEAVVKNMTMQERKAYGLTLLDSLEPDTFSHTPAASVSLCENAAFIKERLVMIKMNKKSSFFMKIVTLFLTAGLCFGAFYLGAYAAPSVSSGQTSALGKNTGTSSPVSTRTADSGKTTPPAQAAAIPDGFTVLKTETVSLSSVRNLQFLLSYEDVTLYPSPDNTLTLLFCGNNSCSYTEDEIVSIRQTAESVTLESGTYNPAWNKLRQDKWQPKIYLYLPAVFMGNLHVEIGSGSLKSTENLQADSVSFDTSSGEMTLMDINTQGRLSVTNHSGSTRSGALSGGQCDLENLSGTFASSAVICQTECTISNTSGTMSVGKVTARQCQTENLSGKLNLKDLEISGSLELSTVSGPVSAGQVTGKKYTISTNSGALELQNLAGNGSISCGSGSVLTGTLELTGPLAMDCGSGSIETAIPENTGIKLGIGSVGSGDIYTFFPVSDEIKEMGSGSIRYGSAPFHTITASTGSGFISIEKDSEKH